MPLKSVLEKTVPRPVRAYFADIQRRLVVLERLEPRLHFLEARVGMAEAVVDALLDSPRYKAGEHVGFNGQAVRKTIFRALIDAFDFGAIVETGTWLGSTTGYMAETSGIPVFSGELNHRFHAVARMRLADIPSITLSHADSRRFLADLAGQPELAKMSTFFYLDAHWYSDLPLEDEIEIIATHWPNMVIMVDDFQVPGDEGYGYDNFGPGKVLTLEYIAGAMKRNDLSAWFPSVRSSEETGSKRGCVILARHGPDERVLASLGCLRPER